jgi:hypothetical protein
MEQTTTPYSLRDLRQGRYSKNKISSFLVPDNSVANSINVNFDEVVGAAKVRNGTTKLGDTVASGKTPLGLAPFVGAGGSPNVLLAVFTGASTASVYYYDSSWHTSGLTNLNNSAKVRFAVLGGRAFLTNNVDGMKDSADGDTWGTTNTIATRKPSLIYRYKGRMLAGGDPTYPSRIFFSTIIDPASSPFITWNIHASTGDWIDINPDDGGQLTGFSESSTFCLVFKDTGMYRFDTVSKTVDAQNIFNVGAASQEGITLCQGVTYFFSGLDIRRTNGGYPEQISRLGIQDFIDAIPKANWTDVTSGTDGLAVYFRIGNVTVSGRAYTNVVLKFSPRDQSWSVHTYPNDFKLFASFTKSVNA